MMLVQLNLNDTYDLELAGDFERLVARLREQPSFMPIKLICTDYSADQLEQFTTNILQYIAHISCNFTLLKKVDDTELLIPVYAFDRKKFMQQMANKVRQVISHLDDEQGVVPPQISEHKINRVQGKKVAPQQQQFRIMDHQLKSDPEVESTASTFSSDEVRSLSSIGRRVPLYDQRGSSYALINAENIDEYRHELVGDREVDLLDAWHKIVAIHRVDYIDLGVMREFLAPENYAKLSGSFVLSNLPVVVNAYGAVAQHVELQQLASQKHVLALQEGSREDINEYTLVLGRNYTLPVQQSFKDANLWPATSQAQSVTDLQCISNIDAAGKEQILEILLRWSGDVASKHVGDLLLNLDSQVVTKEFLRGCVDILVTAGSSGLIVFLDQLAKVDYKLFESSLKNRENFTYFASQDGIDKLIKLSSLSRESKQWWQWLVAAHARTGDKVIFSELFAVFYRFENDLATDFGKKLPPLPFNEGSELTCNMPVMLKVILDIVGVEPTQLHYLSALENGVLQAHKVITSRSLRVVTQEMQLHESFSELATILDPHSFAEKMVIPADVVGIDQQEIKYRGLESSFLLFCARKQGDFANFKYDNYEQIRRNINELNTTLEPLVQGPLLYLNDSGELPENVKYGFVAKKGRNGRIQEVRFCDNSKDPRVSIVIANADAVMAFYRNGDGSINVSARPEWSKLEGACGRSFASYVQKNRKILTGLDYRTKSSLLYIAAIASSGNRAASQQAFASHDLKRFLQSLTAFATHFNVQISDLIQEMHAARLDTRNCPTLAELADIFDVLHKSFPSETISPEVLQSIFAIIKEHGNHAVAIVSNICEVAQKKNTPEVSPAQEVVGDVFEEQKGDELPIEPEQNAPVYQITKVTFITSYVETLRLVANNRANLEKAAEIARVLALLSDYDTVDENTKVDLGNAIHQVSIGHLHVLVEKLATLDVKASGNNLTTSALIGTLQYANRRAEQDVVPYALDYLHDHLKFEFKYRVAKVEKSRISITKAIDNVVQGYSKFSGWITGGALAAARFVAAADECNLIRDGFADVDLYIKDLQIKLNNNASEDLLIDSFNKVANRLRFLRDDLGSDSRVISTIKSWVVGKFAQGDVGQMIEVFFENFSLSAFMDNAIENCVDDDIDDLMNQTFTPGKSLKRENAELHKCLWQFMKYGAKATGFGLVEIDFDPLASCNHDRLKRECLKLADGIVLYNDALYHVQSDKSLVVRRIHLATDVQQQAHANLVARIKANNGYRDLELDSYRLLKIEKSLGDLLAGQSLEERLFKYARELSPGQSALILYRNKLYTLYHQDSQVHEQADDEDLKALFRGNFTDRVAVGLDAQLLKEKLGEDRFRNEYTWIKELGIDPVLFVSDTVNLYDVKFDVFCEVLRDLQEMKQKEPQLFKQYRAIFEELALKVEVIDDLIFVIHHLNCILQGEPEELRVRKLEKILYIARKSDQKVDLKALRLSMEEMVETHYQNGTLQKIIDNMIPFCMHGSLFPLNVFKEFEDETPEFLEDILQLAVDSSAEEVMREELQEVPQEVDMEDIFQVAPEQPIDVFAQIKELNQDFDPQGIKHIQSALLKALVADSSKKLDFQRICLKVQGLGSDHLNILKYYRIFEALNAWQKQKNAESLDDEKFVFTLADFESLLDGLESNRDGFERIYNVIFATRPYPNSLEKWREFFAILNSAEANAASNLEAFLVEFDRHPYGDDIRQKAEEHFKTTKVLDIINGMQRMPDDIPLTYAEKERLVKEFSYVNALRMGAYEFHPVDENGALIALNAADGTVKPMFLHDCDAENKDEVLSTDELKSLAKLLKNSLQKAEADRPKTTKLFHVDNRKLVLQYLAVMFELYYRTTGRIPNPAQVITVIEGIDNPGKQFFEIETAEGKSVTTALFAGLLCAKKSTVFVPTASDALVKQDLYAKKNDLFFEALGFNSGRIDANTKIQDIELGSIYYGTSSNIDAINAECRIMHHSLRQNADDEKFGLAIVEDETDNNLDNSAQRSSGMVDNSSDTDLSPTWIIRAINEFIRTERYSQIEKVGTLEADDKQADERNLKDFLVAIANKKAHKLEAMRQIERYEPQFREFLDIADDVYGLEEGVDFQVLPIKDEDGYSQATPINRASGFPDGGSTYTGYVQAFLHDRLNLAGKHASKLDVAMAPLLIDSKSHKAIAEDFDYFIGLSATVGSRNEVIEMTMPATRIPPFREKVRYQLTPQAVKDEAAKHLAILDAIRFNGYKTDYCPRFILDLVVRIVEIYKQTYELLCKLFNKSIPDSNLQPILVFVNNPKEAQQLADKIRGKINKGYTIQVITGKESEEELDEKVKKAGQKNVVTIGEPVLGRGMDYKTKHSNGIFVIKAFNSTLRGKVQVLGRCGRDDKPGTFLDILSDGEFSYDSLLTRVFGLTRYQKEQQVIAREEKINAASAVQRYFTQEVDAYIQVILSQFDEISHILKVNAVSDDTIFMLRAQLLADMQKSWEVRLEATDPHNKYGANKYVPENQSALASELGKFAENICQRWHEHWLEKRIKPLFADLSLQECKHRWSSLIEENMLESIKYRKLSQQAADIQMQRIAEIPQELLNQRLERFVDGRLAVTEYDELGEQAHKLRVEYAALRLQSLLSKYSRLGLEVVADDGEIDVKQNFINIVDALISTNQLDTMSLYPLAKECLEIVDSKVFEEDFAQDKIDILRNKFSKVAASKEIVNRFKERLNNIRSYLFKLGIKTNTLEKVFTELYDVCPQDENAPLRIEKLYTALHKCLCLLQNDDSIFPFANFLFGSFNLKGLLKQTIVEIEGLYTLEKSLDTLKYKEEIGTCAGYFEAFLSDKELEKIRKRAPKNDELFAQLAHFFKDAKNDKDIGFAEIEELLALCRYYRSLISARDEDKTKGVAHLVTVFSFSYHGVKLEDSIDILIAKLKHIKSQLRQDNPGVCFTQRQKYLSKKSKKLKERIQCQVVDIEDLQISLRWNGVKVAYEIRLKYTGILGAEFAKFTGLTILDSYFNKRTELMQIKIAKEQDLQNYTNESNLHNQTLETASSNYRSSSWFNSFTSYVTGADSAATQKYAAERIVQTDLELITNCQREIDDLTQQIEELEMRMRKFGADIKPEDPANIAPESKTAVMTFDNLESLLTFENSFRDHDDALKNQVFTAVPVA